MQNAGSGSATFGSAAGAAGVHENPFPVEVRSNGRVSAIGRCTPVLSRNVAEKGVEWTRLDIQRLKFAQATSILVLQGFPLMKLFEGVVFSSLGFHAVGTFVLLRGRLSAPHAPPLVLEDIVLGQIAAFPEGLPKEDLMSTLLGHVLSASSTNA